MSRADGRTGARGQRVDLAPGGRACLVACQGQLFAAPEPSVEEDFVEGIVPAGEASITAGNAAEGTATPGDVAKGTAASSDVGFADDTHVRAPDAAASTSPQADADPLSALLQAGVHLVSALRAAGESGAGSHPWVERDPATGARSLKLPLPPPQTTQRLADALAALAESLRATSAGE